MQSQRRKKGKVKNISKKNYRKKVTEIAVMYFVVSTTERQRLRPKNFHILKNITKTCAWCCVKYLRVSSALFDDFFIISCKIIFRLYISWRYVFVSFCGCVICEIFHSIFFALCTGWVALRIDHLTICVEEEEFNRKLRVKEIRESDSSCADTTTKSVLYDFWRRSDFNKNIQ